MPSYRDQFPAKSSKDYDTVASSQKVRKLAKGIERVTLGLLKVHIHRHRRLNMNSHVLCMTFF